MGTRFHSRTSGSTFAALVASVLIGSGCSSPTTPGTPVGLSCPATITAQSPDGQPITVSFSGVSATGGVPPITVTCTPAETSRFAVGATTVTCSATDANHQNATCTLTVTVTTPPLLAATRFVAFGDSITRGEDGTNSSIGSIPLSVLRPDVILPDGQTYPGVLSQLLIGRYTRQTPSVTNAGLPGEMLSDPNTLGRFTSATPGGVFDVVLLMEGSNDVNAMNSDLAVEAVAIGNLQQMVENAKSRGLRVLLATLPPMNAAVGGPRVVGARLVPEFNDRIRALAVIESVPLVDVYTAVNADINTFIGTVDGLHPTPAGYARIASTFLTAIEQNLETTVGPVSLVRARR